MVYTCFLVIFLISLFYGVKVIFYKPKKEIKIILKPPSPIVSVANKTKILGYIQQGKQKWLVIKLPSGKTVIKKSLQ